MAASIDRPRPRPAAVLPFSRRLPLGQTAVPPCLPQLSLRVPADTQTSLIPVSRLTKSGPLPSPAVRRPGPHKADGLLTRRQGGPNALAETVDIVARPLRPAREARTGLLRSACFKDTAVSLGERPLYTASLAADDRTFESGQRRRLLGLGAVRRPVTPPGPRRARVAPRRRPRPRPVRQSAATLPERPEPFAVTAVPVSRLRLPAG